jgi:hypothetical protein
MRGALTAGLFGYSGIDFGAKSKHRLTQDMTVE